MKIHLHRSLLTSVNLAGFALLVALPTGLLSQSIAVPNGSFESQSGVGQPFGVNVLVDSWQKPAKPAYFDAIEQGFGIFWVQTAGVFVDTNPYGNRDGTQAGYILPFPQAGLFQDYDTVDFDDPSPTHAFNALYQVGLAYELTLGVFGKGMAEGDSLQLSLYYRDASSNMVTVASAPVLFSTNAFVNVPPLNLIDYTVSVPTVQAGDAWAGRNIGIKIEAIQGTGTGNWDFDNVRLTAVPEPGTLSLLALGIGTLLLGRRFACRRN